MTRRQILLTGGTGIVGSELLRKLALRDDVGQVTVLLRGSDEERATKERWVRRWSQWPPKNEKGDKVLALRFVSGDVSAPLLGLEPQEYGQLCDRVDTVFHSAANTSFSARYDKSALCNLAGSRHAAEFVEACSQNTKLSLISTVFVAGTKTGTIAESVLDAAGEFSNNYERTKAEAEALVRDRDIDSATYRLSVVVGRASDGAIARTSGIYPIFGFLHRGLLSMVPGDPEQKVDLIPADVACDAILALHLDDYGSGETFHIASGASRSFRLDALLPAVAENIAALDPAWAKQGFPLPVHVSESAFEAFLETVTLVAKASLRSTMKQMQLFTKQLNYPKLFDNEATLARLSRLGVEVPRAQDWLPTVIETALAMNFRSRGWQALPPRSPR